MNRHELRSCRLRHRGRRVLPVVTVTTSVWDIHRLCECEWVAPDYSKGQRAWRRIPDPSCPCCIMSAGSRAVAETAAAREAAGIALVAAARRRAWDLHKATGETGS